MLRWLGYSSRNYVGGNLLSQPPLNSAKLISSTYNTKSIKLFYSLKCNARHTGFLDFFGIIFQKNGQETLFLPLYCWLNTSVSFWNTLQNQKNVSFLGKRDFCTVFCDGHYILANSNKSINFVTKSRMPYLLWCVFIFSLCLRNTFS